MIDSRSIIDNILQAIVIIDKDYNIIDINSKAKQILGDIPLGKKCYNIIFNIDNICKDCPIKNKNFDIVINKTINNHEYQFKITPLNDCYIKEIFDFNQFFKVFENYIEEYKFIEIGHISAAIAHRVNNLLMGISGRIEALSMLHKENKLNGDYFNNSIEKIEKNINSIKRLMDEILFFAHPERMKKKKVNLNNIIREMYIFSKYEIERQNLKLILDLNDIPEVFVEERLVMQLIMLICRILSKNFTDVNQKEKCIKISTGCELNEIFIKVSDNNLIKCKKLEYIIDKKEFNYENFVIRYCLLYNKSEIFFNFKEKEGNQVVIKFNNE